MPMSLMTRWARLALLLLGLAGAIGRKERSYGGSEMYGDTTEKMAPMFTAMNVANR
jgi:hypothetical protein